MRLHDDLPGDTVVSTMRMPLSVHSLSRWVSACEATFGLGLTFCPFEDEQGVKWIQIRTRE